MRSIGTEINMLARLGFPKDKYNLEGWEKDRYTTKNAYDILTEKNLAHLIYAVTYRGKRCRNKTPLYVELQPKDFECFTDDASFFKRTNELYSMGCSWIGAFHSKNY